MASEIKTCIISAAMVSGLGCGVGVNAEAMALGRSCIAERKDDSIYPFPFLASAIPESCMSALREKYGEDYTRTELLFISTIEQAVSRAGLDLSSGDCCIILSSTKGSIDCLDAECSDRRVFLWKTAEKVAGYFGMDGDSVKIISNACISGLSAAVVARRLILSRRYRHAVVAGCDILSRFAVTGFAAFRSLSPNICRPYDISRDGLNLGEACGAIVLSCEEKEGAVLLSGGAVSDDANHISGPSRTGDGLFFAIRKAMSEAGVTPEDISFIDLHGTATVYNDEMESKAVSLAGLEKVPAQSMKPYFGHTLGASGVIETIMCVEELKSGLMFGTPGFSVCGVPMPMNISSAHRKLEMRHCVKTASGFGGCNAALVLSLPQKDTACPPPCSGTVLAHDTAAPAMSEERSVRIPELRSIRTVSIENCRIAVDGEEVFRADGLSFGDFARTAAKRNSGPDLKFFKMDNLCKLGCLAAEELLKGLSFAEEDMAVILSNSSASLDTDIRHLCEIDEKGNDGASPAIFVYTLPNIVAGEICIRHRIKGENTFFITREYEKDFIRDYASAAMSHAGYKYCMTGWCEYLNGSYAAEFELLTKI